jgi:uncharacterized protein DUF6516
MRDEAMERILDYDRRRYWLENGWSLRFRIGEAVATDERPHGLKYAFTLHDVDGARLLGFDNAHGARRTRAWDHRHRFRKTEKIVPYDFSDTDTLLCDFFDAVEQACKAEGIAFEVIEEDLELEDGDEAQESD